MKIEVAVPHTVKKYLIDFLVANNLARKLQIVEHFTACNQEPLLLKAKYDNALEGIKLNPSGTITPMYNWEQMGATDEELPMLKALDSENVGFYLPLIPSLDSITKEVWQWQTQFDGRASISGVINHLKNEIKEFEETEVGTEAQEKEFADLYILLMHLAALCDIDVRTAVATKLEQVKKRDYSAQPDEQGCITHKK